jgi:DNA-binding transcriptional ArsR family regulator
MCIDVEVVVAPPTVALKALAEPLRWRIVELLAGEELCVCHLTDELGVAQPLVSHHLSVCGRRAWSSRSDGGRGPTTACGQVRSTASARRSRIWVRGARRRRAPATVRMTTTSEAPDVGEVGDAVLERLSVLDRFLPVWILAAMGAGLVLGRFAPGLDDALEAVKLDGISLPIALGLLLMMYPVLAKVRYGELGAMSADRRLLGASLALNWLSDRR